MRILAGVVISLFMLTAVSSFAAERFEPPRECRQCGMDRVTFGHGRMLVEYVDGTVAGTCSLNCTVVEMKVNKGKKVNSLKVADYRSEKLIDAKTAVWVVGGNQQGIMTEMPKWAFSRKEDAQRFVNSYGGRITGFDEALDLAVRENR